MSAAGLLREEPVASAPRGRLPPIVGPESTAGSAGATVVVGRFAELEDALCERVLELKRGRPLEPLTVVVGSAAVRTRTRDLLIRRLGAVANVSVVTLERLGRDLVTRARGAPPVVLGGLARERLLRRLVAERAARGLAYYGPVSARPHFAQALAATFDDLRQALVEPGSGWATTAIAAGSSVADRTAAGGPAAAASEPTAAPDGPTAAPADADRRTRRAKGRRPRGPVRRVLWRAREPRRPRRRAGAAARPRGRPATLRCPAASSSTASTTSTVRRRHSSPPCWSGAPTCSCRCRVAVTTGLATALAAARALGLDERRVEPPPATRALSTAWPRSGVGTGAASPSRLELIDDGTLAVVSVADERGEAREATRVLLDAAGRGVPFWDCAVVVPHGDDVERLATAFAGGRDPRRLRAPRPQRGRPRAAAPRRVPRARGRPALRPPRRRRPAGRGAAPYAGGAARGRPLARRGAAGRGHRGSR